MEPADFASGATSRERGRSGDDGGAMPFSVVDLVSRVRDTEESVRILTAPSLLTA